MYQKRADETWLRQQRVLLYTDALRHVQDLRQKYFSDRYAGLPPGGRSTLAAQDDVSARMTLLAHAEVRQAWVRLVDAERNFDWWVQHEYSGAPDDEGAPHEVLDPLKRSLADIERACQKSLGNRD